MGKVIVAIKTERKCKLCSHPNRPQIDQLLLHRSQGDLDHEGKRINGDYVIARCLEFGVVNPTIDNFKAHLKHCQIITEDEAETAAKVEDELRAAAVGIFERILGADWRSMDPTPDQITRIQRALYLHELEIKVRNGQALGLTHDHALMGVRESHRAKESDAMTLMLASMGRGIEAALNKAPEPKQLPPVDVEIEAEEVAA